MGSDGGLGSRRRIATRVADSPAGRGLPRVARHRFRPERCPVPRDWTEDFACPGRPTSPAVSHHDPATPGNACWPLSRMARARSPRRCPHHSPCGCCARSTSTPVPAKACLESGRRHQVADVPRRPPAPDRQPGPRLVAAAPCGPAPGRGRRAGAHGDARRRTARRTRRRTSPGASARARLRAHRRVHEATHGRARPRPRIRVQPVGRRRGRGSGRGANPCWDWRSRWRAVSPSWSSPGWPRARPRWTRRPTRISATRTSSGARADAHELGRRSPVAQVRARLCDRAHVRRRPRPRRRSPERPTDRSGLRVVVRTHGLARDRSDRLGRDTSDQRPPADADHHIPPRPATGVHQVTRGRARARCRVLVAGHHHERTGDRTHDRGPRHRLDRPRRRAPPTQAAGTW